MGQIPICYHGAIEDDGCGICNRTYGSWMIEERPNAPLSQGGAKCDECKRGSVNTASRTSSRGGKTYYFCCEGCQATWVARHPRY